MSDVSRETTERLKAFERLVSRWSPRINLVSAEDLPRLWERHIHDSRQMIPLIGDGHLVDLGSGGGFPGLVIAAGKAEAASRVTLMEADARKAAFLRTAIREMHLSNVIVLARRIEEAPPQQADYITARALAPLPQLLGYVHRHLRPGGSALLMKGSRWRREVDAALQMWEFTLDAILSSTDPSAAILHVTDLRPR